MADLTPVFRRTAAGRLILQDSPAAIRFKNQPKKDHGPPKKGEVVKIEATEAVKRAGGDVKSHDSKTWPVQGPVWSIQVKQNRVYWPF